MPLDEASFHSLADKTISALAEAIDTDLGDEIDVEEQNEILTLVLPDGGQYIINKNAPLKQVWLSSPRSGAWHFDWDAEGARWRSTRGERIALDDLLAGELKEITGTLLRF
ncbi:iron donor protein CyaY [Telmatospirillum siberiense]|uniref:Iron-sulfur cluster assembly protein CyaY n=1 Tax=Telmatospirillum siberiense TaxID=382514 RepID=A0A2N3Q144_9PROT|nr:iron donor protein CyaY [Telmatospirillum siberiense]PKU26373.1 iron donor protein CyaY [Telmatospirillum siberiense]